MVSSAQSTPDDVATLGAIVRRARTRLGLSVAQLAERAEVSMGLISQIERGQGNPALGTLVRLADGLGLPVSRLFRQAEADENALVRADDRIELPPLEHHPEGFRRQLLSPRSQGQLQLIRSELPAGFSNEEGPYRHLGMESVHVLEGRLRVVVGERDYRLGPGDTVTYSCAEAHWWANDHDGPTIVLGAVIPIEP